MTEDEFDRLPDLEWMPSRIPLQDALTNLIPPGSGGFPKEKLPLESQDGIRKWTAVSVSECSIMGKRSTRNFLKLNGAAGTIQPATFV
jgi:hypothetical protein